MVLGMYCLSTAISGSETRTRFSIHLQNKDGNISACLVENLGETVENFITASAAVSVTDSM